MQVTFAVVNAAIHKKGGQERLVQVGGLFAFADGNSSKWPYRMVRAGDLQSLTVDQWVGHWERLSNAAQTA
jgi:hypothetical protein